MAGSTILLDHLIKIANKSGALKPAPQHLKKLKQNLEKVPFKLLQPGMSGVQNMANLLQGLASAMKNNGGSSQGIGNLPAVLAQSKGNLGQLPLDQIQAAVGAAITLGASLDGQG